MLKLATTAVFVSFATHASLAPAAYSETAATAAAPTTYVAPAAAVTKTVVVTKTVKTVPAVQRLPEFETIRAALLSPRPVQKEALYKVVRVEASDVLNVRGGPSADTPRVGTLDASATHVRITGLCEGRWCPVAREQLTGWVNRGYLETEEDAPPAQPAAAHVHTAAVTQEAPKIAKAPPKDPRDAPRSCLTKPARALLVTIEAKFGRVQLVSTCRPGATISGSGRPSRHASGNAVDFKAGGNKAAIVTWLIANHKSGGTMTYADMDHIHVDIGPHFVSLAGRRMQSARASSTSRDWSSSRMSLRGRS